MIKEQKGRDKMRIHAAYPEEKPNLTVKEAIIAKAPGATAGLTFLVGGVAIVATGIVNIIGESYILGSICSFCGSSLVGASWLVFSFITRKRLEKLSKENIHSDEIGIPAQAL